MRLIGLCGRSGSGKSLFSKIAEKKGIKVIDCDRVYKNIVSKRTYCLSELEEAFGASIIENESLNRRVLAKIVFSDAEKLALLNRIAFKYILKEVENIISGFSNDDIVLLDAPTLFESGLDKKCDLVVGVVVSDEVAVSRIMARDNISKDDAMARLKNQLPISFLTENCHKIIYNESTLEEFEFNVTQLINEIKEGKI